MNENLTQWFIDMDEDSKHEFTAVLISNAKGLGKIEKEALKYFRDLRLRIIRENLDEHGYLGSEILALKKVFGIIYNQ